MEKLWTTSFDLTEAEKNAKKPELDSKGLQILRRRRSVKKRKPECCFLSAIALVSFFIVSGLSIVCFYSATLLFGPFPTPGKQVRSFIVYISVNNQSNQASSTEELKNTSKENLLKMWTDKVSTCFARKTTNYHTRALQISDESVAEITVEFLSVTRKRNADYVRRTLNNCANVAGENWKILNIFEVSSAVKDDNRGQ